MSYIKILTNKTTFPMTLKYKILVGLLSGLSFCGITQAQNNTSDTRPVPSKDTLLFQFVHGKRMFWADYKGNKESILAITRLIRTNKPSIESGEIKVRVLGFCSSSQSAKENLAMALFSLKFLSTFRSITFELLDCL